MTEKIGTYLKKHTEALVKDVGVEAAAQPLGQVQGDAGALLFGQTPSMPTASCRSMWWRGSRRWRDFRM